MRNVLLIIALSCALFYLPLSGAENNPKQWNYDTGYTYLLYSYAAYCPVDTLTNWTCKWCKNNTYLSSFEPTTFAYYQKEDVFGFVGVNKMLQQLIISFRGTHDLKNWIVDLQFAKTHPYKNYTNVKVHDGFDKAWNNLKSQILGGLSALQKQYPSYPVVVTGHSLGAAIATLCAMDVATVTDNDVYVWHYGDPRVGNKPFSELYNQTIKYHFRHVNNRDIVPHLPLKAMGFYHTPTEVWERGTAVDDFKVCDGSGEDKSCSDSLWVDLSVYDHLHYFGVAESCNS